MAWGSLYPLGRASSRAAKELPFGSKDPMHSLRLFARAATFVVLIALTFGIVRPAPAMRAPFRPALSLAEAPSASRSPRSARLEVPSRMLKTPLRRGGVAAMQTSPKGTSPRPAQRVAQGDGGLARAQVLLAAEIARHPILRGTTVRFGYAQGYQAISYYRSGQIIVSPTHTASLERIMAHEVWHIIDWRDNGRIDWGENVPR